MFRRISAWLLVLALAAVTASAQTVDELIEKYLQAQGGREKVAAIKSMRMEGKMEMGQGMQMPIKVEVVSPDRMRFEGTMQGMTMVQAVNGESGWQIMPFMGKTEPEPMSAEDVAQTKKQLESFDPLSRYKELGHTLELAGKEDIEGTPAHKLKLTRKDGEVTYVYLDAESYLLIKTVGKTKMQGQEVEVESSSGDYKEVGGVLFAHTIESKVKGAPNSMTMTFTKVEFNPSLPASDFEMPKVQKKEPPAPPKPQQ
jgi:outer membrane lipoprotein-sorting protein